MSNNAQVASTAAPTAAPASSAKAAANEVQKGGDDYDYDEGEQGEGDDGEDDDEDHGVAGLFGRGGYDIYVIGAVLLLVAGNVMGCALVCCCCSSTVTRHRGYSKDVVSAEDYDMDSMREW